MEEPFTKVWSRGSALGLVTASPAGPGDRVATELGRRGTHKEKRSRHSQPERTCSEGCGGRCKYPHLSGILLVCPNGQACKPGHQLGPRVGGDGWSGPWGKGG